MRCSLGALGTDPAGTGQPGSALGTGVPLQPLPRAGGAGAQPWSTAHRASPNQAPQAGMWLEFGRWGETCPEVLQGALCPAHPRVSQCWPQAARAERRWPQEGLEVLDLNWCRHRPHEPDPGEFSPPTPIPAQLHLAPACVPMARGVLSPRCCPLGAVPSLLVAGGTELLPPPSPGRGQGLLRLLSHGAGANICLRSARILARGFIPARAGRLQSGNSAKANYSKNVSAEGEKKK